MAFTPKKTKPKKSIGLETGDSGSQYLNGIVSDEYNTKLRDISGVRIYDEMRKSDGTVSAAVLAVSLPIRRANWFIKPASEDAADVDIAKFVEKNFFDWMTITWNDTLRQSLLSMPLGVMVFEKVYETRSWEGKDYVTLRKLAPRLPKSIQRWEMANGEPGIEQRKQDGALVDIPMEKLVVFVNDKEGDNWWGTSILRPGYKHWFFKNNFYKIDAISFERQGLGIPYAKLPQGATEADRNRAKEMLQNMRANHQAYIIEPHDYEIGFKDMMARTTRDPATSIAHHNREIVKSVLAQFLELGSTDSGSRALSTDQTDLFLQSIEATARAQADVYNKYVIEQLVDLNFDGVEEYPKLDFNGISRVDVEKLTNAYTALITSGAVIASEADERYLRELMGLPERDSSEDMEVKKEEPNPVDPKAPNKGEDDAALEDVGLSAISVKKKVYPTRTEVVAAIKNSLKTLDDGGKAALLRRTISVIEHRPKDEHSKFFSMLSTNLSKEYSALKKNFAEETDFKGYRPLTFAEKKVDYKALQKNLDRLEEQFEGQTRELLHAERTKFMSKLSRALERNDIEAIKNAGVDAEKSYTKIIKDHMKEAYEFGKAKASEEMKVKIPKNVEAIMTQIDIQADAIAEAHLVSLSTNAKNTMTQALTKGESNIAALALADRAINDSIEELTRDTSRIVMASYINTGRTTVFEENEESIYALQRSEILDAGTCNYCLSVDGRVVDKTDPFAKNNIFHSGCRGIWVEIMLDEQELPKIGGVPKGLRDRFGDAVNDLIQPKNPQTQKDTLARKEAERRARSKAEDAQ